MNRKPEAKAAATAPAAPFDALLQAGASCMSTPAQFAECWQRQLNAGLRIVDAALGSAVKVRDAQMPAASEVLARAAELQKALIEARSPLELWTIQCNWMMDSATRAIALWKGMFDAATEASATFCSCLREEGEAAAGAGARMLGQASVGMPGSLATQDLVKTALVSFDAAYGQMLKGSQQAMAAAAEAFGGRPAQTAASKPPAKRGGT